MSLDMEGVVWLCSGRRRWWWPHRVKWPMFSYPESCSTQASSCILEDSRRRVACVLSFKRGRAPSWSNFVPSMANPHKVYPIRAQKKTGVMNEIRGALCTWIRTPRDTSHPYTLYPDIIFGNRKGQGENSKKFKHFPGNEYFKWKEKEKKQNYQTEFSLLPRRKIRSLKSRSVSEK